MYEIGMMDDKKEGLAGLLFLLQEGLLSPFVVLEESKLLSVHHDFARIFGYSREELIGKDFFEMVDTDSHEALRMWLFGRFPDDLNLLEIKIESSEGASRYIELYGTRRVVKNRRYCIISKVTDITDRKLEEKAAREIQERFRAAFHYAAVGMALVGVNGRFIEVNYAMCEILGALEEELQQSLYQDWLHPDETELYLDSCTRLLIGEIASYELEQRYRHVSGRTIWVLLSATLVRDELGKPLYYIMQLQDTTERRKAEELLRKSDKLSAVGQLAAGVAHEVRNPLTVLKGFTQMLLSTNEEHQQYYRMMLSEVDRIEAIIGEFLLLAKPQETKFNLHSLGEIVHDVVALMETKAVMNNVEIVYQCHTDNSIIECDANQLKQVYINMLQNAVDAMPRGGQVSVELSEAAEGNYMVRIADQGCGIPEERIARLGEPFYSSKEKGTGLGLMVSYQIIGKHKGRIYVSSRLNEGTTFEIILPARQNITT